MPDFSSVNKTPPKSSDLKLAAKYLDWLVELLNKDKITAQQSDLTKFPSTGIKDHFRISLMDYDVEISRSQNPQTNEEIYTMIFNNLSRLSNSNQLQRTILAYIHLTPDQFDKFKNAAKNQLDRIKRLEEEKRFKEAMAPIDQVLQKISNEKQSLDSEQGQNDISKPLPEPMKLPPVPEENLLEEASTEKIPDSSDQAMPDNNSQTTEPTLSSLAASTPRPLNSTF